MLRQSLAAASDVCEKCCWSTNVEVAAQLGCTLPRPKPSPDVVARAGRHTSFFDLMKALKKCKGMDCADHPEWPSVKLQAQQGKTLKLFKKIMKLQKPMGGQKLVHVDADSMLPSLEKARAAARDADAAADQAAKAVQLAFAQGVGIPRAEETTETAWRGAMGAVGLPGPQQRLAATLANLQARQQEASKMLQSGLGELKTAAGTTTGTAGISAKELRNKMNSAAQRKLGTALEDYSSPDASKAVSDMEERQRDLQASLQDVVRVPGRPLKAGESHNLGIFPPAQIASV